MMERDGGSSRQYVYGRCRRRAVLVKIGNCNI